MHDLNKQKRMQPRPWLQLIDISHFRLIFGFSLLYTDRVPFELLDSAALL
jgi:hypothetical protein